MTGLQNRPVAGVRRVSAGGSVGVGRRGVNREGVLTARGWGCWAAWKGRWFSGEQAGGETVKFVLERVGLET